MMTDSKKEQFRALEDLMEVLFHRRQVPSGMLLQYYKNAPAARQFFAPELQPFFDQIWNLHQKHVQRFVQAWQAASEEIRERMRPGTPEGDILTLLFGDPSVEERNGIIFRLAERTPTSLQDRGAKERLAIEARARGKEADQLLREKNSPLPSSKQKAAVIYLSASSIEARGSKQPREARSQDLRPSSRA
jgi:hypothetical protein